MEIDDLYQTYENMDEALAPPSAPYTAVHDMALAQKYLASGLYTEALSSLNTILEQEKTNAQAHYLKGLILLEQNQPVAAIYALNEATRWHPAHAPYRIATAQAFIQLNDKKRACAALVKALMLEHDDQHAQALVRILQSDETLKAVDAERWVADLVAANKAFDQRQNVEAENLYRTLSQRIPQNSIVAERLLNLERQRKHPGQICPKAWDNARLRPDGHVEVCCLARFPVGDLKSARLQEIWDGPEVQKFRESILDDSYRFCPHDVCHSLRVGQFPTVEEHTSQNIKRAAETGQLTIAEPEITMTMVYDQTCNLSCPSCRTERIVLKGEEFDRAKMMHDLIKEQCLHGLARVHVSGQGDPFASRLYRDLLYSLDVDDYPNLAVDLHTNGLLLNQKSWDRMVRIRDQVETIAISIDAATEDTYRRLRRGGELKHLLPNLEFAGHLRRSGAIKHLRFNYVVQEGNYTEMPAFVRMGAKYGADTVNFQRRRGHSKAEIFEPAHPGFEDFLDVLEHPDMQHETVQLFWGDESLEAGGRPARFNIGPNARKLVDEDEDQIVPAA